ncbi:MAG: hypothetical protein ABH878_06130, partial [bacterium]
HLENYASDFQNKSGVQLAFPEPAKVRLYRTFLKQQDRFPDFLDDLLKDYIYGVKLLGVSEFKVGLEVLADAKGTLDRLIKMAYEKREKRENA